MSSPPPRVSVLMVTYNQQKYVEQAVRSALAQEADFPYEIVIGEDCSTDGTRPILHRLQAEHPSRLRLLLRDRNLGLMGNYLDTYSACRGEYIATLAGDDYWTDTAKLAKQVAVLDADTDCSLCFHPTRYVDAAGVPIGYVHSANLPRIVGIDALFESNPVHPCSVMLRKAAVPVLPPWMRELKLEDWPLFFLAADVGHFVRLDDVMTEYRVHPSGVWSMTPDRDRLHAVRAMFAAVNQHFEGKYAAKFRDAADRQFDMAFERLRTEHAAVVGSLSYRLGRALTYPLRAVWPKPAGETAS